MRLAMLLSASTAWALSARVEGESIVITDGTREVRLAEKGLRHALLAVVPLRADGSDPAIFASVSRAGEASAQLIRFADPPEVLISLSQSSSVRGISSTSRSHWLVDLDGDGWNDLVEYTSTRSDVGTQDEGPSVMRWDPAAARFSPAPRLRKLAPRALPDRDRQLEKLLAARIPQSLRWSQLDTQSTRVPTPIFIGEVGLTGSLPFVGRDLIQLRRARNKYFVAHIRLIPKREVVSIVELGRVSLMPRCPGHHEEFVREAGTIRIVWPIGTQLVEQRLAWDGNALAAPVGPPVEVERCEL